MTLFGNSFRKSFHAALLSSVALATPAFGQPAEDDQDEQPPVQAEADPDAGQMDPNAPGAETGAIIVTGSRIARRDLTSTSPLAVVQDEEFRLSGSVNVEQVMNSLPQVIPGASAFSNNPGGGVATLNLRGLGISRTLVLVNGRRWIFYSTNQAVDLNTIPAFLIDSVDVVTGGASAVYGSDAIAGVVNFRLRTNLDGIIAGTQYSITEEGDGRRYEAHAAVGTQFGDGRGHVAAFAEYFNRGSIMQGDRAFSRSALGEGPGATSLVPSGSATVPQGRITAPATVTLPARTTAPAVPALTLNVGAGTNFGSPFGAFFGTPGTSTAYLDPQNSHNFAPENFLMVPQERWLLGGYGEYELTDNVSAYTEVTFVNNRVANELAATPVTGNVDLTVAAQQGNLSAADFAALQQIAANQAAANAAAVARGQTQPFAGLAAGNVRLGVNRRVTEIGSRNALDERNSWRALAGVRGGLFGEVTFDAFYSFARNRNSQIQTGNVSRSAFNREVAAGRCNVFGAGTFSEQCVSAISILAQNTVISQLQVGQASIAGPLFQSPWSDDPIGFAVGGEWRSVSARFIPDTALSSGDVVGFNAGNPTEGGYNVAEAFAELRIPIITDGFIHRLELNGAARYSDYSLEAVGGVWTYAAGAEFAPVPDITFRGQYQRAVRAPNVGELFGGQSIGFPAATDPCSSRFPVAQRTEAIRQLCIASGVPATAVFTAAVQPNAQIQGRFGGNPNLQEETSDTYTAGVVLRPRFMPRLNITVDYYDITIQNAIATAAGGVNNILNLCYTRIQDLSHPLCQLIARNPQTGAIEAPFVVTATTANLAAFETNGVDFQIDYSQPLGFSLMGGDESRLSFFFLGNWTDKNNFTPVQGLPDVTECAGRFGLRCGTPTPKWSWSSRLSFIDGPATASLRWRRVGEVEDDNPNVTYFRERIGSYDLFDLSFAFDVNDNFTLNMGVNNLLDRAPPVIGNNQEQANTFPSRYDVLGRDYFISANLRF